MLQLLQENRAVSASSTAEDAEAGQTQNNQNNDRIDIDKLALSQQQVLDLGLVWLQVASLISLNKDAFEISRADLAIV